MEKKPIFEQREERRKFPIWTDLAADREYISRGRISGFMNTEIFAKRVPIYGSVARTILRPCARLYYTFILPPERLYSTSKITHFVKKLNKENFSNSNLQVLMCSRKILINKFLKLDDSKNYLVRETAPYDGIVEAQNL